MQFQFQQQQQIPNTVLQKYAPYIHNRPFQVSKIGNEIYNIDVNYDIKTKIGDGAYGVLVAAQDLNVIQGGNQYVAIKKIVKAFEQRVFTKRTLRELKLLRILKHPNIIKMKTLILPQSRFNMQDIYCVQELMEVDLYQVLQDQDVHLKEENIKFFLCQIFKALSYMHKAGIVHRDLKPRNILINRNSDLKLCDFGLARCLNVQENQNSEQLTDYVITRWYRAPEVLLSYPDYSTAVDIWSVGIIFAEILQRRVLLPGSNSADQLVRIFNMIGTPEQDEIAKIPVPQYRQYIGQMQRKPKKNYKELFPEISDQGIDLIDRMLQFDADKRITAEEALKHPFFDDVHIPDDQEEEPVPNSKILKSEFEFENYPQLTMEQFKDLIYEEILLYHFPQFKQQYMNDIIQGISNVKHVVQNGHYQFQQYQQQNIQ